MMHNIKSFWFLIIVLAANVIQCITGFAGTVLAMPFSIMLVGFDVARPILNVLGIIASVIIVWQKKDCVNKKELLKITCIMLAGMVPGFLIINRFSVNSGPLYKILGIVVIGFTVLGIVRSRNQSKNGAKARHGGRLNDIVMYALLLVSGVVHGMFVCGGPLLVVYANDKLKESDEFRSTVSAVWIILNSINMFTDMGAGRFNKSTLILLAASTAMLFLAMFIGNLIYKHMNKKAFMVLTYTLMAISGLSLLVK